MTTPNPTARRRLFLDDEGIAEVQGLRRVVNQPVYCSDSPVLQPERPWEMGGISHYGTVLFDDREQLFKLWYFTSAGPGGGKHFVTIDGQQWMANRSLLCYALSRDGLRWERPALGQVEFEGSTENNILRIGRVNVEGVGIIHEPHELDPQRRYKALWWEHGSGGIERRDDGLVLWAEGKGDGIWVAFSPDGVNWTNWPDNPVLGCYSDTSHYVVRDRATGRYAAYGRFGFGRTIARTESEDFVNWSEPQLVLEPDAQELAGPPPDTQFYGMTVDLYEGLYLGGLWIYRPGSDGRIDTQLAVSRDGIAWTRVAERQTFLPTWPDGTWADGMVRPAGRFITRDASVLVLHGMVSGPHSGPNFPGSKITRRHPGALGLATLRRDGFVSLDADREGGCVLTSPFRVPSGVLHLNVDAAGGEVVAELVGAEAHDGPALARSPVVTGNFADLVVPWENELQATCGQSVRLRITVREGKLYSYWFAP